MTTRLHYVKSARKADKAAGIKVGDAYYWWKFRRGGKYKSKTRPPRSRLTRSSFLATMYDAEDAVAKAAGDAKEGELEDLASALEDAAGDVRQAGEDAQSSFDNMPEGLQQGDTGQLLEQRVDWCNTLADEIDNAAEEVRGAETLEAALEAVEGISWEYE